MAELAQRSEQEGAQFLGCAEVADPPRPQAARQVELAARDQPVGKVVALGVEDQRADVDPRDAFLQFAEIVRAHQLGPARQAEDEVAEAEVAVDEGAELGQQLRRLLVQEGRAAGRDRLGLALVGRLQQDRQVGDLLLDAARQLDAGVAVRAPAARKADVRDHAQQVVAVALVEADRVFEVLRQQDLRARPHAHPPRRGVDALRHQRRGLAHDLGVHQRQVGRVEAHRVLDQDDHPHADLLGVVDDVHLVLDQLDDGQEHLRFAVPDEDVVKGLAGVVARAFEFAVVKGQQHHRDVRPQRLGLAAERRGVDVAERAQHDDQLEVRRLERRERASAGIHAADRRRAGQAELGVLGQQHVGQLAVLAQVVDVVQAGDQQHVLDPERHQRVETRRRVFEGFQFGDRFHTGLPAVMRFGVQLTACVRVKKGRAPAMRRPARLGHGQTTPWSSIESATLMKPAMLAPRT